MSSTVSLAVSITLAPQAQAQSLFQKLFGFGGGHAGPAVSQPLPRQTLPAHRFYHHGGGRSFAPRHERAAGEDDEIGPPGSGGPYRTMCVRTCDGFYFPLRHDAVRKNFAPDVKSCRSACGTEARLFYFPENGGSVDGMIDLAGAKYSELPHAFAYRKKLLQGCTCKPVPWSGEEAARHEGYAMADAAQKAAEVSRSMAADAVEPGGKLTSPVIAPAKDQLLVAAGTLPPKSADAQQPAESQAESGPADSQTARETYEPVRVPVEKVIQRRRTPRIRRERATNAGYKTTLSPGWFKPSKSGLIWPGDAR